MIFTSKIHPSFVSKYSLAKNPKLSRMPKADFFHAGTIHRDVTKEIEIKELSPADEILVNYLWNSFFESPSFIYPFVEFMTLCTMDKTLFNSAKINEFSENFIKRFQSFFQNYTDSEFKMSKKDKELLIKFGQKICRDNFSLENKESIYSAMKCSFYKYKITVLYNSFSMFSINGHSLVLTDALRFTHTIRSQNEKFIAEDKKFLKTFRIANPNYKRPSNYFLFISVLSGLLFCVGSALFDDKNDETLIYQSLGFILVCSMFYKYNNTMSESQKSDLFKEYKEAFDSKILSNLFEDKKYVDEDFMLYILRSIQIKLPIINMTQQEELKEEVDQTSSSENSELDSINFSPVRRDSSSSNKGIGKIPKGKGEATASWESLRTSPVTEMPLEEEDMSRLVCRADVAGIKKDIYRNDINLREVIGDHGEVYYIYWDEDSLKDYEETDGYNILRKEFEKAEVVKGARNSSGIKKMTNLLDGKYLIEIKPNSHKTNDRILGSIIPDNTIQRFNKLTGKVDRSTCLYVFNKYDVGGKITGH